MSVQSDLSESSTNRILLPLRPWKFQSNVFTLSVSKTLEKSSVAIIREALFKNCHKRWKCRGLIVIASHNDMRGLAGDNKAKMGGLALVSIFIKNTSNFITVPGSASVLGTSFWSLLKEKEILEEIVLARAVEWTVVSWVAGHPCLSLSPFSGQGLFLSQVWPMTRGRKIKH